MEHGNSKRVAGIHADLLDKLHRACVSAVSGVAVSASPTAMRIGGGARDALASHPPNELREALVSRDGLLSVKTHRGHFGDHPCGCQRTLRAPPGGGQPPHQLQTQAVLTAIAALAHERRERERIATLAHWEPSEESGGGHSVHLGVVYGEQRCDGVQGQLFGSCGAVAARSFLRVQPPL